MKVCPLCEKELEDEVLVCDQCGYSFENAEEQHAEVYEVSGNDIPEEETKTEEVDKPENKSKFLIGIIAFAVIIALGIGTTLGSIFYLRPKYEKLVTTAQNDMANYGFYYGLYQISQNDEDSASAYAYYVQMALESFENSGKTADRMTLYLYGAFALSGVLLATGVTGLTFSLILKKKSKEDDEPEEEEYTGEFKEILNEIESEEVEETEE